MLLKDYQPTDRQYGRDAARAAARGFGPKIVEFDERDDVTTVVKKITE